MLDTIYIYRPTGFVADTISQTNASAGVTVKFGDNLLLSAVFNDGTNPIELPADATGVLNVKQAGAYGSTAILNAASWTKQPAAANGYQFALTVNGGALMAALGNAASVTLSAEVQWTTGGVKTTSTTFNFTVVNH